MSDLGWVSDPTETRGPLLLAVFWTLFPVSTITLGLRLWFRRKYNWWHPDDYILAFSWLCFLAYFVTNYVAVSLGFGRHALDIRFKNIETIGTLGGSGLTIIVIGITAAKVSYAVTLLQLTRNLWRWTNWLIWFVIISLIVLVIPTAILPWVRCRPFAKTYIAFLPGECFDRSYSINYGIFQGIYAAITDFVLALLPWKVLWSLQMRPVQKFGLSIAMSLGLVAGAMAIMRVSSIHYLMAQDLSYDGSLAVVWAVVELASTMIAACIPVLRKMVHEEVSTRGRSGPSTSGERTAQRLSSHRIFGSKSNTDQSSRELSLISTMVSESGKSPHISLARWCTRPALELARCSDESTFLSTSQIAPVGEGDEQDHSLEERNSNSKSMGDERQNLEVVTTWPDAAYLRERSFSGTHSSSPI